MTINSPDVFYNIFKDLSGHERSNLIRAIGASNPQQILTKLLSLDDFFLHAKKHSYLSTLIDVALRMIELGADPDSKSVNTDLRLLHHISHLDSGLLLHYLTIMFAYGCNPVVLDRQSNNYSVDEKHCILNIVMAKLNNYRFLIDCNNKIDDYVSAAIMCVEYGLSACPVHVFELERIIRRKHFEIFRNISEKYKFTSESVLVHDSTGNIPWILRSCGSSIDFAFLQMQLKLQSQKHQSHSSFLNLCLLLAIYNGKQNIFSTLPFDILILIGKQLGVDKTHTDSKSLIHFCLNNREEIIEMNTKPGGISVYQHKAIDGSSAYTLFKSTHILCVDYINLKDKLRKSQQRSLLDKMSLKEFSDESIKELDKFKYYAKQCLANHYALFKRPSLKSTLIRKLKDSCLYSSMLTNDQAPRMY